jgi:hypothetical protein
LSPTKNTYRNVKLAALGVTGVIFIAAYFFLINTSPLLDYFQPDVSNDAILLKAESFFLKQPVDHSRFSRHISAGVDADLLAYAQYYKKKNRQYPRPSAGYWTIRWFLPHRSDEEVHREAARFFQIRYDFNGNLVGFWDHAGEPQSSTPAGTVTDYPEDDALFDAKYFLGEYGIKTDSLTVVNKEIKQKGSRTRYKFVLEDKSREYPGLLDRYTVEMMDGNVVTSELNRAIDKKKVNAPVGRRGGETMGIIMVIVWSAVLLSLIVRFAIKLRKDELEFKRALGLGIFLALCVCVLVLVNIWASSRWPEILLGSGLSAVLILLCTVVGYSIAESQTRSTWSEKLAVTDLLFQGKIFFRETGAAILRSFFLVGLTLLTLGVLFRVVPFLKGGYITLSLELFNVFEGTFGGISVILQHLLLAAFFGISILSFWPGFLREKIKSKAFLIALLVISFSLGGLQFVFFSPPRLGLLTALPVAFIWAVFVIKYDFLTVFLSVFGAKLLMDLSLVFKVPGALTGLPVAIVLICSALLFLLGIFLVFHPRSAEDYDSYVPEYVNRIAEKERLLKELEIARRVQMRFLPRKVPELPGLEIVSLCQPAMEVGGDYYDFVQLDERHLSVLIGDVSGKGVSAAFYMTMVKGIIKTLSRKTRQPAALLAEANEIFWENAPRNVFVTVIYGVFDLVEKTLTIASAGHNPLIAWKKKTNTTKLLNPRGVGLGLVQPDRYKSIIESVTIPIEENDIFVFYTDGVSESMNARQEIFGEERLQEAVRNSAHLSSRAIQKNIVETVSRFSGKAPQHDDFTMVVVKVGAQERF